MSASTGVCSRCLLRLSSSRAQRALHYRNVVRRPLATSSATRSPLTPAATPPELPYETSDRHNLPARLPESGVQPKRKDKAIRLFEEVLAREEISEKRSNGDEAQTIQHLIQLTAEFSQPPYNTDHLEAYKFFRERILPSIRGMNWDLPKPLYARIMNMMAGIRKAKTKRKIKVTDLPSHTQLSLDCASFGVWDAKVRLQGILELLEQLSTKKTSPDDFESIESYEYSNARREELLDDLVGVWQHLSMQKSMRLKRDKVNPPLYFDFPVTEGKIPRHKCRWKSSGGFLGDANAVDLLFPQYLRNQLHAAGITPAILATYAVITDPQRTSPAACLNAKPLLDRVEAILVDHPPSPADLEHIFQEYPVLQRYMISRWNDIVGGGRLQRVDTQQIIRPAQSRDTNVRGTLHKQLITAFDARNVNQIKGIWADIKGEGKVTERKKAYLREQPGLFDKFLYIWCYLKENDLVKETTELMKAIGLESTVRTYTSMLNGLRRSKQTEAAEKLWSALRKGGLKMDTGLWTARISALLEGGRPEQGIGAVHEMMDLWKEAVRKGTTDMATKPTTAPVNALLAGLLRMHWMEEAQELLAWASREGIDPDVITYNTLLQPMLGAGLYDAAAEQLKDMRARGIEPDTATFTIISEGDLERIQDATADEQVAAVEKLFERMNSFGLPPNEQVYGKVLHTLLRSGDSTAAAAAVKTVLAHMHQQGVKPSAHIHTILAEHYFSRNPPDLAAVRALLADEWRLSDRDRRDPVLWEAVARGFAEARQVVDALEAFNRMAAGGSHVPLAVADLVLRLLVSEGEDAAARRVVKTMAEQAPKGEGERSRHMQHRFWHFAKNTGLLADDALSPQAEEL